MKIRYLLPLLFFVGLIALFAAGLRNNPRELPSVLVGKPAPGFSLPALREEQRRINAEALYRGQPVSLLNVWASWCSGCREEHSFLMELSRKGDLPIFGLNYKDERPDAIAWLSRHGNPYREVVADKEGRAGIDYGVYGVPETFVVDGAGVIRYRHAGPLSEAIWRAEVQPVIDAIRAGVKP